MSRRSFNYLLLIAIQSIPNICLGLLFLLTAAVSVILASYIALRFHNDTLGVIACLAFLITGYALLIALIIQMRGRCHLDETFQSIEVHYAAEYLRSCGTFDLGEVHSLLRQGPNSEPRYSNWHVLRIIERAFGEDSIYTVATLIAIGNESTGAEGISCLERALRIEERHRGQDHENLIPILQRLAVLAKANGRDDYEPLLERVLSLILKRKGPSHPELVQLYRDLAEIHRNDNRGEGYLRKALAVRKDRREPPDADILLALTELLAGRKGYDEAEELIEEGIACLAVAKNNDWQRVRLQLLARLVKIYQAWGRRDRIEGIYREIIEGHLASKSSCAPVFMRKYAAFLREQGRDDEAEAMKEKALAQERTNEEEEQRYRESMYYY
jgi:tetratricopeptide (TPR) repeat protein